MARIRIQIQKNKAWRGVASLPTVLTLGILILAAGLSIAAVSFSENSITKSQEDALAARRFAEAGARDALERIARNKSYSATNAYQIEFAANGCVNNASCAIITVSTSTAPKIIVSEGHFNSSIRTVQATVTFDASSNGEMQTVIWSDLSQ